MGPHGEWRRADMEDRAGDTGKGERGDRGRMEERMANGLR